MITITGHPTILSHSASEDQINFTLSDGCILRFDAESSCCDSSWFVLSDIDEPTNLIGATAIGFEIIRLDEELDGEDLTYGFNLHTSAGTYHARMANDHGASGYYSGFLTFRMEKRS